MPTDEPTPGETPDTTPRETPTTVPSGEPTETPNATPGETPDTTPGETPDTTPGETPATVPSGEPTETHTSEPGETPNATPGETPDTTPGETPTTVPSGEPTETPTSEPGETPDITPGETPTTEPGETPTCEPNVTPTSEPAETEQPSEQPTEQPSEQPAEQPSEQPTVQPTEEPVSDPVVSFVGRVYKLLLERDPAADQNGVNYWTNILKANNKDGSPFGGARLVQYFIVGGSGKEYTDKKKSNKEFLKDMYAVLMDRNRETVEFDDKDGFNYWMGRLDSGEGRELIVKAMANCTEYKNHCKNAGIEVGDFDYYTACSRYPELAKFVARMYTKCLDREFDADGLEYWVGAIAKKEQSINSLAAYFFNCPEFNGLNLTNEEKIKRLYRTFFDREAEEAGLKGWLDALENKTQTWESEYTFFIYSDEFKGVKARFGL